jgi:hypothetical protein
MEPEGICNWLELIAKTEEPRGQESKHLLLEDQQNHVRHHGGHHYHLNQNLHQKGVGKAMILFLSE